MIAILLVFLAVLMTKYDLPQGVPPGAPPGMPQYLFLDESGSMKKYYPKEIAKKIINAVPNVGTYTFSDRKIKLRVFSESRKYKPYGNSPVLDAAIYACKNLPKSPGGAIVLFISDFQDSGSKASVKDVEKAIQSRPDLQFIFKLPELFNVKPRKYVNVKPREYKNTDSTPEPEQEPGREPGPEPEPQSHIEPS